MASQFHNPYYLPSQTQEVPDEWKSNANARPVSSSLQTVVVSSMSGSQAPSGRINLSIPAGPTAGIMQNPYLKFKMTVSGAGNAAASKFGFSAQLCTALINRYVFSINGVIVDTISNADLVYNDLIAHVSSADYQRNDLSVLMNAYTTMTSSAGGAYEKSFCIPLLGCLSAPSFPLYLCNGQVSIDIDLNTPARAFFGAWDAAATFTISGVQLVYDRITVSDEFVSSVKAEQMAGKKFVVPYTNVQSILVNESAGANNLNVGLNVSSLDSVLLSHVLTADLSDRTASKASASNSLTQYQVTLDGRLINAVNFNSTTEEAACFMEAQKALSRAWDASVSDPVGEYTVGSAANAGSTISSYLTRNFFVAVNGKRCNSRLSFVGTAASVCNIQWTVNAATYSAHILFLSGQQLLIDAQGNVELLR